MAEFKYQYGRLSYRKKSTGQERGREDWSVTRNRDGTTTMRCLAITDDSKFVRDVCFTRSKDGRPVDAFVRLQVDAQLIGIGYFRVDGGRLHVTSDSNETGHVVQTVKLPNEQFSIVTHSVMLDGWTIFNYDRARGGQQSRTIYNTSKRWDGTDGPLGKMETCRVKLLGEEEVTVPAGTFKATHFTIDSDTVKVPTAHLWVAGEDRVLLRCDWGDLDHEYVLTSWKTEQR